MTTGNRLRRLNARVSILKELQNTEGWSPALIREIIKHLKEPETSKDFQPETDKTRDIIFLTSRVFDVSVPLLYKKTRLGAVNDARQVAMHLMVKQNNRTLTDIGRTFSRDHSTVIHANRKVRDILGMGIEKDYISKVRKIEKLIEL